MSVYTSGDRIADPKPNHHQRRAALETAVCEKLLQRNRNRRGDCVADFDVVAVYLVRMNLEQALQVIENEFACLMEEENIDVVWSPGSFEIPVITQRLATSGKYSAVICLGAVIRGGTDHNKYISSEVTKGVAQVAMNTGVPCTFGVLTCDTIEQAIERAGTKAGNKGADAAAAAVEMANLIPQISKGAGE